MQDGRIILINQIQLGDGNAARVGNLQLEGHCIPDHGYAVGVDGANLGLIKAVHGYRGAEAVRVNEQRPQTRQSAKKSHAVLLTQEQANALMIQPNTPLGRRDQLLITLLLEHGLRVSELALLEWENIADNEMRFYRPKLAGYTQEHGHHILTMSTLEALTHWQGYQMGDYLLRKSRRGGHLAESGMSERAITDRVRVLGQSIGVQKLSAHDCRHYCATHMASIGYMIRELMVWLDQRPDRHAVCGRI